MPSRLKRSKGKKVRFNPKTFKSCTNASMKWIKSHKSTTSKGKKVKVRGSCRKKHNKKINRAFYGSRFSSPYCPGVSKYNDDTPDGGKKCDGTMGTFIIDKDGNCNDDKGCSLAVTGPVCPGISIGVRDLKDGRECSIPGGKPFKINKNGDCAEEDKSLCATSATSVVKAVGGAVANAAGSVADAVKEGLQSMCPGVSSFDGDVDGGKMCVGTMGRFKINAKGECVDPKGCSLAASGPVCPGISRGVRDLPDGVRECIVDTENRLFNINKAGECVDPKNCATSATSVVKAVGGAIANAAGSVADAVKAGVNDAADKYKMLCPGIYIEDKQGPTEEWKAKGAVKACKGQKDSVPLMKYLDKDGKELQGRKRRNQSRKQKRRNQSRKQKRRSQSRK